LRCIGGIRGHRRLVVVEEPTAETKGRNYGVGGATTAAKAVRCRSSRCRIRDAARGSPAVSPGPTRFHGTIFHNTGFHNTSFYDTGTRRDHACNQPRQASPQAQAAGIG
jgi:hypothetical protein